MGEEEEGEEEGGRLGIGKQAGGWGGEKGGARFAFVFR